MKVLEVQSFLFSFPVGPVCHTGDVTPGGDYCRLPSVVRCHNFYFEYDVKFGFFS